MPLNWDYLIVALLVVLIVVIVYGVILTIDSRLGIKPPAQKIN